MALNLDTPPGATPLDADEFASLIPDHIVTQGELNEWEQQYIQAGDDWARKQTRQRKEFFTEAFVRQLHKQMFGETWRWAGKFRKPDKNIGTDWLKIGVELKKLLDDAHYQIEHVNYGWLNRFLAVADDEAASQGILVCRTETERALPNAHMAMPWQLFSDWLWKRLSKAVA
jgi:fido (protein-threonine AMPylation protein)